MSNPLARKSIDAQAATGAGDDTQTLGHTHLALFAAVDADPSGGLTVVLEGSPDRERWVDIAEISSFSEDEESGEYTGYATENGGYFDYVRARITSHPGGTESVDAYVTASGNPGQGRSGIQKHGAEDT